MYVGYRFPDSDSIFSEIAERRLLVLEPWLGKKEKKKKKKENRSTREQERKQKKKEKDKEKRGNETSLSNDLNLP